MLRDRLPVLLAACIAALCLATFIRFDASSPEQPEAAARPEPPPTAAAPPERRDAMPAFYDDGSGAPSSTAWSAAPPFDAVAASAKDGGRGHADKARTRARGARRRYGNATLRRAGLSEADLAALARLPDARLLRRFAYDRGYR
ncbi:hypothetical protein SO694_000422117 [Aureococcus anophagefferens]|uniref:Uncharacterized protein n=1 Tax=Aureococcus anophagefferens TaxID=44056 RepID=A0ABR1G748_AURAN